MKNRSILSCMVMICMVTVFQMDGYARQAIKRIDILYTQNNNGQIDNCNCPSNPLGGFEKRYPYMMDWLNLHPNTLVFDTGDFLSFDGAPGDDEFVVKLMEKMPYHCVNLGDQELSNGVLFFQEVVLKSKLPLMSANLMLKDFGQKPYSRYRLLEMAGLHIAVVGLIDPESVAYYMNESDDPEVWAVEPEKAFQIIYQNELKKKELDLIVVLSNLGLDKDKLLAEKYPVIDVILGGHSQHEIDAAERVGKTIIVQCGKDGHYLGHLQFDVEDNQPTKVKHERIPMGEEVRDSEEIIKLFEEL